jgi:nucleotide-binding universal stress UspA family protein
LRGFYWLRMAPPALRRRSSDSGSCLCAGVLLLGAPWEDQAIARHVAARHQAAGEAAQKLQEAELEAIIEVLERSPADAILRVADIRQCDLIVMGSRGHEALASLLLGSVSRRVLAHARVPLVIVSAAPKDAR